MDKRGVTHGRRQAHLESHRLGSIKVGDLEDKKKGYGFKNSFSTHYLK